MASCVSLLRVQLDTGAYPEIEGGGCRTDSALRAKFFPTTPTQQYSLTEIQRLNRQECLQSPRMAPSAYKAAPNSASAH